MQERRRSTVGRANCSRTDAIQVAQSMRRDFADLVAAFDQQLSALTDADSLARSHVLKGKAAAERGVKLSRNLIESINR